MLGITKSKSTDQSYAALNIIFIFRDCTATDFPFLRSSGTSLIEWIRAKGLMLNHRHHGCVEVDSSILLSQISWKRTSPEGESHFFANSAKNCDFHFFSWNIEHSGL